MKRLHHNGPEFNIEKHLRLRKSKGWDQTSATAPVRVIVRDGRVRNRSHFNKITNPVPLAESPVTASAASGSAERTAVLRPPQHAQTVNNGAQRGSG